MCYVDGRVRTGLSREKFMVVHGWDVLMKMRDGTIKLPDARLGSAWARVCTGGVAGAISKFVSTRGIVKWRFYGADNRLAPTIPDRQPISRVRPTGPDRPKRERRLLVVVG